jgi:hypothetical protein
MQIKYYQLVSVCNKYNEEEVVAAFLDLDRAAIRAKEANEDRYKKQFRTARKPYKVREMLMDYVVGFKDQVF